MTYRLGSSGLVYAPGLVPYLQLAYRTGNKSWPVKVLTEGWGLPRAAAVALLKSQDKLTIEGETVVFTHGGQA